MIKVNQNSPKSCQIKVKDTSRWHLNGLYMEAHKRGQTWSIRYQPFKALKEHQMKWHDKWFQTIETKQVKHARGVNTQGLQGRLHGSYTKQSMDDPNDQKQTLSTLKHAQKLHKAKPKSC
ncbi:hypothetical protein CsSME_00034875 [Camellia sinensis var. sinensis]